MRRQGYSEKVGLPPGSTVYLGDARHEKMTAVEYVYDATDVRSSCILKAGEGWVPPKKSCWIRAVGVHDVEWVSALSNLVKLNPLAVEDIANTLHPSKFEDYGNLLFFVLKIPSIDEQSAKISFVHFALIVSERVVISFEEYHTEIIDAVSDRLMRDGRKLRSRSSDYLGYAIIDSILDTYLAVTDALGFQVEQGSGPTLGRATRQEISRLFSLRTASLSLRRAVSPLRDIVRELQEGESALLGADTVSHLPDLRDHVAEAMDHVQFFREHLRDQIETQFAFQNQTLNERMTLLTLITAIFIPLSFIAGVYGMNFEHMPELSWRWGYPGVLALMATVATGFSYYFYRKGWWV